MSEPVRKSRRLADAAAIKEVETNTKRLVDGLWHRYVVVEAKTPAFDIFRSAADAVQKLDDSKHDLVEGLGPFKYLSEEGRKRVAAGYDEQMKLLVLCARAEMRMAGINTTEFQAIVDAADQGEAQGSGSRS